MSVTSGFFNSLNGDRKYNATSISKIFDGLINDGIYMSVGNAFLVNASSGMNVIVKPGRAWFNHTWTLNDADFLLTIDPAELVMTRIDAVILEVNNTDEIRGNTIKIIKGTPAEVASKPTLTNNEDIHQYALAYITVDPKVTTIEQTKIENVVGTKATPYVNAIVETIDTSEMYAQFTAQFNEWFDSMKDAVSDNAVLDLATKMAGLTKTDNSVPTLLYRYVLFPDSLTEAEKLTVEGNTDLMTLVNEDKKNHVQIGDVIYQDDRVSSPLPGYLRATGGIVQAADYPEYYKKLSGRKFFIKRTSSGNKKSAPWYEYVSGDSYPYRMHVVNHCRCGGYTVLLVDLNSKNATNYQNGTYCKIMVFNPKGERIYSANPFDITGVLHNTLLYGGAKSYFRDNDTPILCAYSSVYFEDPNTVVISTTYYSSSESISSGVACIKLVIDGDTVTVSNMRKITNGDVGNCVCFHVPNTNATVIAVDTNRSSYSNSGAASSYSNGTSKLCYRIVNEDTGGDHVAWISNATSTWDSDVEADETAYTASRATQDRFLPSCSSVKFTEKGVYLMGYKGWVKIAYGATSSASRVTSGYFMSSNTIPENASLLDIHVKKGDWMAFEDKHQLFNMKTGEIKETTSGSFIGAMVFDDKSIDLYVSTSGSIPILTGIDSETDEILFSDFSLAQYISAYSYKANATNFSAKNFIIIGHKIFVNYPEIYYSDTTNVDYVAPEERYKEYYEISLEEMQLPKVDTSAHENTRALVRVK